MSRPCPYCQVDRDVKLYNFRLVIVICGAWGIPILAGLLGCFAGAQ